MALTQLEGFFQPVSSREAAKLLHQHQDSALVIGGGTFIHGLVARGLVTDVKYLVDIGKLKLNHIDVQGKKGVFGASVTFDDIESNSGVANSVLLGSVNDAMTYPPPQVKHAATVGGCVAASCPFLDLPVALLALDASATAQGRFFKRSIPFEELFVSLFGSSLKPGEFITEISFPQPDLPTASAFQKLETNANDLAIINVAVRISIKEGRCSSPRLFIGGGVGETPYRCKVVEEALEGQVLSRDLIEQVSSLVHDGFEPLSDHRASARYRKAMAAVFTKRCLLQSANRLGVEV